MAADRVKRKISAILSADVVGYSRPIESDEDIGNQEVKNIPDPVRVYRILVESGKAISSKEKTTISASDKPSIAYGQNNIIET